MSERARVKDDLTQITKCFWSCCHIANNRWSSQFWKTRNKV